MLREQTGKKRICTVHEQNHAYDTLQSLFSNILAKVKLFLFRMKQIVYINVDVPREVACLCFNFLSCPHLVSC